MKKNALLTFIFACIPGAGQMYYGYMQRGLSLIALFCGCFMLGTVINPFVATMLIVWMYSFFDTYDLIRHMAAGEPKEDGLLLFGNWAEWKTLIPNHSKLLGWGLVGIGAWAMYDTVISDWLADFLYHTLGYDRAYSLLNGIPNVIIAVLLIFSGIKLLGLHPAKKQPKDELPPFPGENEQQ